MSTGTRNQGSSKRGLENVLQKLVLLMYDVLTRVVILGAVHEKTESPLDCRSLAAEALA